MPRDSWQLVRLGLAFGLHWGNCAMAEQTEKNEPAVRGDETVDEGRRHALAKLGRYGAYTAPALLGLLMGTKSAEAFSF